MSSDERGGMGTWAREEMHRTARDGLREIARRKWRIVQVAMSAGAAWLAATELFGHEAAFFAPISAVIVLGLTVRQRGRRAIELALGVAVGIAIADLIVLGTGTGPWQVAVVVGLAVTVALFLGGGRILVNQAAVSAVLVAALPAPDLAQSLDRFLDALIGGGIALAANALFPAAPVLIGRRRIGPLLSELAGIIERVADSLASGSEEEAVASLEAARALDPAVREMKMAVEAGRETIRMAPSKRSASGSIGRFETASEPIDLVVRDTRVLARGAVRANSLEDHVPESVIESIRLLADAVRNLDLYLAGLDGRSASLAAATEAAVLATASLEETSNLASSAIVAQVRASALDILTGLGIEQEDARARLRAAREETDG
ncbi:MAG: FUSC family protein [Solirubrobacterales bacterium]